MILIDPELQAQHDKTLNSLKNPDIRTYRDLRLDFARLTTTIVDDFLRTGSYPLENWEKLLNNVYTTDQFWGLEDSERYERLADEIAEAWRDKLPKLDSRYRVTRCASDNGPAVTFYINR